MMSFLKRWSGAGLPLALVIFLSMALPAEGAFINAYDPANFTATHNESDATWVLNPDGSLTLTGPNNGSGNPGFFTFLIQAAMGGLVTFDWAYSTLDAATFDRGGYELLGNFTMLADFDGASGSVSFLVAAGDSFGFRMETDDNTGEPGVLTISNFSAPDSGGNAVPEPGSWVLGAIGLLAAGARLHFRRTSS